MIKFQNPLLVIIILITSAVSAQDFKFGKVSKEELQEEVHPIDSSAAAAVLYRKRSVHFKYVLNQGFNVHINVHERVKIYNQSGFKHATVIESLYKNGGDKENLSELKAFTYNLEGGAIKKQKLDKSGVFTTEASKNRSEKKFTLPNIKVGSVIEYQYKIVSPFFYSIDELVLQYDIPINSQKISIAVPEYFSFKPNVKGYLAVDPKYKTEFGTLKVATGKSLSGGVTSTKELRYSINVTNYDSKSIPALKEESHVNTMENYRSAVKYELKYTQYPESIRKDYTTTWEDVIKKIYDSKYFGDQLKISKYYKDDLEALVGASNGNKELMSAIFSFVQKRMTWNSINGYSTDKGVKEAYKEKSGNIADINLMLTSMLQKAGLDANPILVSTRNNGVPLFPTREGFNYVVASVQMDGETVLLDASNKYTKPNLLPTRALNWYGKLIKKDGAFSTVNLLPKKVSKENYSMSISLSENGDIEGKCRTTYSDYDAYMFRNNNASTEEEDYLEKLENKNAGMEISEYAVKNKMTIGKPIMESFAFNLESQADVIGGKIYFSPLFHMALTENPFKLEERQYPIDFTYPRQERYVMNIVLPEGYEVASKPEDVNMVLADNLGGFKYKIVENDKSLQVMVDFKINQAVISSLYYADLKELFKNAVEKQTEKVVLSKITSDGTSESSEGGR